MTKLLDPKPLIPIITGVFGVHPAAILHGEKTPRLTLVKWCCFYFIMRFVHMTLSEVGVLLQCHASSVKHGIQQIDSGLAGARTESRFRAAPTNAAIKDAVAQCEAAILKHFPQLNTTPAPETRRP